MSWKALQYGVGIVYSLQVGWKPVGKISASYELTARPSDDKLMYAEGQYSSHRQNTITGKSSCRCHYVLDKFLVDSLGAGGSGLHSDKPATDRQTSAQL